MADPFGYLKYKRKDNPYRPVDERIRDWKELQTPLEVGQRQEQAARCMNCGIPFCHSGNFFGGKRAVSGCPNDNLIPEWNDLLYRGEFKKAWERLSRTNPLPEMTGRVCPAPCEKSCTEALNGEGVAIHDNERFIIDYAFEKDWVKVTGMPAGERTGYKVAIVGSGPAGLSAAWRLNQLGHSVTVYERSDRLGGLLMYGIPNMKLDKSVVQRRIEVMQEVGICFETNCEIGKTIDAHTLRQQYDRVILCTGASVPRDLEIAGRQLSGIRFAVDYLTETTKHVLAYGKEQTNNFLAGKHVVVIGGGDTGNDCIASVIRQGCASVKQLEINPESPLKRNADNPWPEYPMTSRLGYGQEEARMYQIEKLNYYQTSTTAFLGSEQGQLVGIQTVKVNEHFQTVKNSEAVIRADIVLLAMGFVGPENQLLNQFGVTEAFDDYSTNDEKIYLAGDARRGPSLVIWAIREGRKVAEVCDASLRSFVSQK